VPEEGLGIGTVIRIEHDPDARRDVHELISDREGLAEELRRTLGDRPSFRYAAAVRQADHELVGAEAGRAARQPSERRQPLAELA